MAGRRGRRGAGEDREKGISTVEVVALTPVIILFALTVVGLALYAENVSQVQEAATDVARMASLQNTGGTVTSTTAEAAKDDLGATCNRSVGGKPMSVAVAPRASTVTNGLTTVTVLEATVVCNVSEFGISYTITESSYAPVDTYGGQRP